jgi:hypothetical protein
LLQQASDDPSHLTTVLFFELSTPWGYVLEGLHPRHDLAARHVLSLPCQVVTAWSFAPGRALAAIGALRRRNPSGSSRSSLPAPSGHVPSLPLVAALLLDPAPPPEALPWRHGDRRRTPLPPVTRAGPSAVGFFPLSRPRRIYELVRSATPRRAAPARTVASGDSERLSTPRRRPDPLSRRWPI